MKPCIRDSRKFYEKYEVVVNEENVIQCYNYATAVTILKRIIKENEERIKT